MKKKYLESLQMNISNAYCEKCKHHLHLDLLNLFNSFNHFCISSIFFFTQMFIKTVIQMFVYNSFVTRN